MFLIDLLRQGASRRIFVDLVIRDYQQQYQGTYLGFVWMFIQPMLFIGVLYLVFTLGFRAQQTMETPFSLHLICGMVIWIYFSGNLSAITEVVRDYGYLVKKVDLDLRILPLVKVFSSALPHLFLVSLAIFLTWLQGYGPTLSTLQVAYYFFATAVLLVGIGWITASARVFVRDTRNVVAVLVQFGFWLTPVFWNLAMIPEGYRWIVKLNPVYYLVTGYRDSIVHGIPFWEKQSELLYFWTVASLLLLVGYKLFKRLRPHFAEVM